MNTQFDENIKIYTHRRVTAHTVPDRPRPAAAPF